MDLVLWEYGDVGLVEYICLFESMVRNKEPEIDSKHVGCQSWKLKASKFVRSTPETKSSMGHDIIKRRVDANNNIIESRQDKLGGPKVVPTVCADINGRTIETNQENLQSNGFPTTPIRQAAASMVFGGRMTRALTSTWKNSGSEGSLAHVDAKKVKHEKAKSKRRDGLILILGQKK